MLRPSKYDAASLISMLRLTAELRRRMLDAGFTDNGGAIHSAERILNILGMRLCYPGLNHINNLRHYPNAPFSVAASIAHRAGEKVLVEHVNPHRALTRAAIEKLETGATDEEFSAFVACNFKLALLTQSETVHLNRLNRSRIDPDRLAGAGIQLVEHPSSSLGSTGAA